MSSRWQNYNSVCMEKCIYAPVYMCVTCILYIFLSMCQKYCVVTDIEKRLMAIVGGRRGCGIWSESEVAQSCLTLCKPMDSSLHQAPPSMGFSRQEYWSGLPFPSPENLPKPGIKPRSLTLQTDALLQKFTLPHVKQRANGNLWYDSRDSNRGSVSTQRGEVGRETGGSFKGERIYVYLWLIHVDVCRNQQNYG